ncbi:MAG: thiolase family protein [Firmicutes bacterium]|nr:thiolase family protein [Bacillota bacterium]
MQPQVAVVGAATTNFIFHDPRRLEELVFAAASAALADAGVTRQEVDAVVLAACDELDGRSISSMITAAPAGAYLKDEIKVTDEGAYAVIMGALRIMAGVSDVVLAVSWSKVSEAPLDNVTRMRAEPFFHRDAGLNHMTALALVAGAYRRAYGVSPETTAEVVVKNRRHALLNPWAAVQAETGVEDVLASPTVAWPLRRGELAPLADGACAVVLAGRKWVEARGLRPVWLKGFAWAADSYHLGSRRLSELSSLRAAARRAYAMAGIGGPRSDINVAEVCDLVPDLELMACEALGFCGPGEGADLLRSGTTGLNGSLPVNPSGGMQGGNPFFCAGMVRFVEAYRQVAGRAGQYQVPGVRTALAHASSGFAGQQNAVFVLGKE